MAKKHKHEDHINHEAWAIPYGDLITLLLAFFVVMYSMSSVNEGKYRVLADSLNQAFSGPPRSSKPVQVGPSKSSATGAAESRPRILPGAPSLPGIRGAAVSVVARPQLAGPSAARSPGEAAREARGRQELERMAEDVHEALGDLIAQKLVVVRRHAQWLEVEIQTDILFTSGSARLGDEAGAVLDRLAEVLRTFENRLRIEGHTDDVPIATREFPSNWELSSARAATVVHRFMAGGIDPRRMAVLGLAEYHPVVANADAASRNRNRRVVVVVMAQPDDPALPSLPTAAAPTPDAVPPAPAGGATSPEHARP